MANTLRKTPLSRVALFVLALAVGAMALVATAQTARAASVTPTPVPGNPTCKTLLSPGPSYEIKVDPPKSGSYGPITANFSADGKLLDFTSTVPVLAVFVKGGTDGGFFYDYRPDGSIGDTGLKVPTNQQISHVSFCWNEEPTPPDEALEVSKTADATYDRTIKWDLEKSVDPAGHSGEAGDSFDSTWTVKATKDESLSNYKVTGKITINNPNSVPVNFSVTDKLDDGTMADVDCDPSTDGNQTSGTVPANDGSVICDYVANPTSKAATSNNVQVSSENPDIPGDSALAPVNWKENVVGDETVKLSDPRFPDNMDLNKDINNSTTVEQPETFNCSSDPADYKDGKLSYTEKNTATLTGQSTNLSKDAEVKVDCVLPALTASKTANGSYDRNISWDLKKSVNPASHSGLAGDSFTSTWKVDATKTVVENNYKVTGDIVVTNPSAIAQTFTVSDKLDDPASTMADVDCDPVAGGSQVSAKVDPGKSVTCKYTALAKGATLNTATVSALGNNDFTATAAVSYSPIVKGYEQLTLSDPRLGYSQVISDTTSFSKNETFKCSTDPTKYTNYSRTDTYENIANLMAGTTTIKSANAKVTVNCRYPWRAETATGAGIRYPGTSNWFMYTAYNTSKVDLIAGQHYDAGDIYMTRSGGNTFINITLASGFRFANVSQNLKVQPFASAPKSYVQPGAYKYKFSVAQGTSTYSAKIPGDTAKFYGIHADVERYVP